MDTTMHATRHTLRDRQHHSKTIRSKKLATLNGCAPFAVGLAPWLFPRHAPRATAARRRGSGHGPRLRHRRELWPYPSPSPVTNEVFFPSRRNEVEGLDRCGRLGTAKRPRWKTRDSVYLSVALAWSEYHVESRQGKKTGHTLSSWLGVSLDFRE